MTSERIDWSALEGVMSYSLHVDEHRVYHQTRGGYLEENGAVGVDDPAWPALVELVVYERTPSTYLSFFGPTIADVVAQYADYREDA